MMTRFDRECSWSDAVENWGNLKEDGGKQRGGSARFFTYKEYDGIFWNILGREVKIGLGLP